MGPSLLWLFLGENQREGGVKGIAAGLVVSGGEIRAKTASSSFALRSIRKFH